MKHCGGSIILQSCFSATGAIFTPRLKKLKVASNYKLFATKSEAVYVGRFLPKKSKCCIITITGVSDMCDCLWNQIIMSSLALKCLYIVKSRQGGLAPMSLCALCGRLFGFGETLAEVVYKCCCYTVSVHVYMSVVSVSCLFSLTLTTIYIQ